MPFKTRKISRRDFVLKAGLLGAGFLFATRPLLAADQTLHIVHNRAWPPFEHGDGDHVKGVTKDLGDLIFKQIEGYRLRHSGLPWERAQALVAEGKADGMIAFPSYKRQKYLLFNKLTLFHVRPGMILRKDHPRRKELEAAKNLDDLKSFTLTDQLGNGWGGQLLEGQSNVLWVQTFNQIYEMLTRRRADLHISPSIATLEWITQHQIGLQDDLVIVEFNMAEKRVPIHFGLRQTLPNARHLINRIDEIFPSVQQQISGIFDSHLL